MVRTGFGGLATLAAAAALLASCGGGVGSGGTGDMAGYGSGTVTGFGSVIVDGRRYDDSGARVEYDTDAEAPDVPQRALARSDIALGQRVELEFETDGEARRASVFRISPTLVGPVTSLAPLKVAGQRVRINADAARGPLTRFGGGLASAQQIALGDRLEVHGVQAGRDAEIQATRVERRPASHGRWLRLTGTVSAPAADGRSFRLGGLTVLLSERGNGRTALVPGNAELQEGARVQVWTREEIRGGTLVAERVRVGPREIAAVQTVQLSGVGVACAGRSRSDYVCLGTTPVALAGASFGAGLDAAGVTAGDRYLIAEGHFDEASGTLTSARFSLPPSP